MHPATVMEDTTDARREEEFGKDEYRTAEYG